MKLSKSKKGVIGQLFPLILSLVVIAITLAITFLILAEVKTNDKVTADVNATAAVTKTQQAMDDIPGWLPIIVVTVIGALLIGLISILGGTGRR